MNLIDTHTHIYDHQFSLDRNETVQRALEASVGMMLLPNVDASTIAPMLELHEQFPDCTRVMMGLQPEEVKEDYKAVLAMMEKELECNMYIGVGEVGLDFYWDLTFEKQQLDAFETQLDWAKQLHLPLSIHCRNAFDKIIHLQELWREGLFAPFVFGSHRFGDRCALSRARALSRQAQRTGVFGAYGAEDC